MLGLVPRLSNIRLNDGVLALRLTCTPTNGLVFDDLGLRRNKLSFYRMAYCSFRDAIFNIF